MSRTRLRLLLLLAVVVALLLGSAFLYQVGMAGLEGKERGFWDSLSWASETLTTTGYGFDSHWHHPAMVLLVVLLQWIGVFLVFLVVPIFLIPFLEERFEARLPKRHPGLADHVVIWRFGPAVATLLRQLASEGIATLVVESDEAKARQLAEGGQKVIVGPLEGDTLERALLGRARALIANGSDEENAAVILAARQAGFAGELLAVAEDPFHRRPLHLAGATAVFTPRHVLGAALAARASSKISPRLAGVQQLGDKLQVAEIRLRRASSIEGRTVAEAEIGTRTGATLIGKWVGGVLSAPLEASSRLDAGAILVAAGSEESLERLRALAAGATPATVPSGPFVIAGFGEVGQKVAELLRDAEEPFWVINRDEREGVDRVGNMLDPKVVEGSPIRTAPAVIIALDSDSATLFATVIVREHAPDVPIIARVNRAENVERIHRAGADFALSISQVSGQILARRLLGQERVPLDSHLELNRVPVEGLVGSNPAELHLRERTGCSVVAVERGDELILDLGPGFRFAPGDAVYVSGPGALVSRFGERLKAGAG